MKTASASNVPALREPDRTTPPTVLRDILSPGAGRTAIQEAICEATVRSGVAKYGDSLKAIVLTGSLARQEGTFVYEGGYWNQFGDSEFLLVFNEKATLPSPENLQILQEGIESELLRRNLRGRISLAVVRPNYLRSLKPNIYTYELLTHGLVLWGEPVISLIPSFPPTAIPLEDAWRLLSNRMIELLEVSINLTGASRELPKEVLYQTVKMYIETGTSFLIFAGCYEPTYAGRAEKMRCLRSGTRAMVSCPLDLARFAERVITCTRSKLSGTWEMPSAEQSRKEDDLAFWESAVSDAHSLWRWELAQLTAIKEDLSDQELMMRWMAQQPIDERIRGWLFVLRRESWLRSWRKWLSWIRRGFHASPRYCVYAAASELFFQLPALISAKSVKTTQEGSMGELFRWLPLIRTNLPASESDWRRRASEIAWNYHRFLEGTRS